MTNNLDFTQALFSSVKYQGGTVENTQEDICSVPKNSLKSDGILSYIKRRTKAGIENIMAIFIMKVHLHFVYYIQFGCPS